MRRRGVWCWGRWRGAGHPSKWNQIEHRLFSQISRNWRARPLTSHEVIMKTIAATTTRSGLKVTAALDTAAYPKGIQITDQQMKGLQGRALTRHDFHGSWNYTLSPAAAPASRPATPEPAASPRDLAALSHPALTACPARTSPPWSPACKSPPRPPASSACT